MSVNSSTHILNLSVKKYFLELTAQYLGDFLFHCIPKCPLKRLFALIYAVSFRKLSKFVR